MCKQQPCNRLRRQLKRHTTILRHTLPCGDDALPEPLLCIPQNVIHAKTDHSLWISPFPENIHTRAQPMPPSLPKLVTNTHVHTKTMHVSTHAHRKPCTCKHTLPPSDLIPCSLSQPQKKHIQQGRCFSSCGPSQCSVEWAGVKKEFKKKKKKTGQLSPLLPICLLQDW